MPLTFMSGSEIYAGPAQGSPFVPASSPALAKLLPGDPARTLTLERLVQAGEIRAWRLSNGRAYSLPDLEAWAARAAAAREKETSS